MYFGYHRMTKKFIIENLATPLSKIYLCHLVLQRNLYAQHFCVYLLTKNIVLIRGDSFCNIT